MYNSESWWNLYQLWLDWEGERWVLPYLLKWWKKETGMELPDWVSEENEENFPHWLRYPPGWKKFKIRREKVIKDFLEDGKERWEKEKERYINRFKT